MIPMMLQSENVIRVFRRRLEVPACYFAVFCLLRANALLNLKREFAGAYLGTHCRAHNAENTPIAPYAEEDIPANFGLLCYFAAVPKFSRLAEKKKTKEFFFLTKHRTQLEGPIMTWPHDEHTLPDAWLVSKTVSFLGRCIASGVRGC